MRRGILLSLMPCLCLAVLAPGCDKGGESATPGDGTDAAGGEQGADADTVTPLALEVDADAFVYLAAKDGPFPSIVDGTRAVLVVDSELADEALARYAGGLVEADSLTLLEGAGPSELGLPALTKNTKVWMFGPEGPCTAKVLQGYALAYEEINLTLEAGYMLEACAELHAPVVYIGAEPPQARWVGAEASVDTGLGEPKDAEGWEHPWRPALAEAGLFDWEPSTDEPDPPSLFVRVREAGPVVEMGYALHFPGAACEEYEQVHLDVGLSPGPGRFQTIESDQTQIELVGALLVGDDPLVVVGDSRFQLQLGVFAGGKLEWSERLTGDYHDEDTASWGWSVLETYCGP